MARIVWEDASTDERVDRWLDDMEIRLDNLAMAYRPPGVRFDRSLASLAALERVVLDHCPAGTRLDPVDGGFLQGAACYLGQTLLEVAGGRWWWGRGPALRFDPALGRDELTLAGLIAEAVERRDGTVFTRVGDDLARAVAAYRSEHPDWEPTRLVTPVDPMPVPESAELNAWLARQEAAFADWAGQHAEDGPWDFSPRSVEALERILLASVPAAEVIGPDAGHPVVELAAWYLGEAMIRNRDGAWTFLPGEPTAWDLTTGRPVVGPDDPRKGVAVPTIAVAELIADRDAGALTIAFEQYVDR